MQKGDEIRLMNFKINNKTGSPVKFEKEIHSLCGFAKDRLGFKKHPTIFLNHDKRNASNTLGKTGYYDPDTMEIHVFATGRHPKDILRSIAHELVHHNQNERGELNDSGYMGKGYAQKNPHMRKMELQANDPMLFRDWEDSLKEKENTIYNERRNRKMSLKEWKNNEIGDLLTDKWGFKMDLGKLNEAHKAEPGEPAKEGNFDDDSIRYSRKEVEMSAKKGNKSAIARLKKMDAKKENVEEGEIPDQLKPFVNKKKGEEGDDDSEDKKDDSDDGKKDDKSKSKSGKMPMKKDTKDADKDGKTDDEVPEFVNEAQLVNRVMKRIRNLIIKGKK